MKKHRVRFRNKHDVLIWLWLSTVVLIWKQSAVLISNIHKHRVFYEL